MFDSGFHHYKKHGEKEGRSYDCIQDPSKIFSFEDKQGCYNAFETFIDKTSPVVKKWSVTGNYLSNTNADTCNTVLFVEGRDHAFLDYALRVHRRYTGPDWTFYLVGPSKVAEKWRQLYEGSMVQIVDLPERFGDLTDIPKQLNDVYMSEFIWDEVIQCERVLVSQTDALLFRHGTI